MTDEMKNRLRDWLKSTRKINDRKKKKKRLEQMVWKRYDGSKQ